MGDTTNRITNSARLIVAALLLVNGIAALYGGLSLMLDPTGESLGLPSAWLDRIPFGNYFIPGLALFIINGLCSVTTAMATILMVKGFQRYVIVQGFLLLMWIVVQVGILWVIETLHFAMASIGFTIIALGLILKINEVKNDFRG